MCFASEGAVPGASREKWFFIFLYITLTIGNLFCHESVLH